MTSELHKIAARYERVDPSVGDVGKVPTARELLASKQKEEWLITELACRGSLLVLAGDTGACKTTFLYGMAQAMSVGEAFMGQLTTQKSKVLVIQADESERNSQRKLQGLRPQQQPGGRVARGALSCSPRRPGQKRGADGARAAT